MRRLYVSPHSTSCFAHRNGAGAAEGFQEFPAFRREYLPQKTAIVDDEQVRPAPGHSGYFGGKNFCRLTYGNRACGFHQGQSSRARKQAGYSDSVRPFEISLAMPGKSL